MTDDPIFSKNVSISGSHIASTMFTGAQKFREFVRHMRDCTLFIEGTGLEIFTKSSLKKSE